MKAKHTPGPWSYDASPDNNGSGRIVTRDQEIGTIWNCAVGSDEEMAEARANARLIAEAPAMAEALRELFEHCAMVHRTWGDGCNRKEADAAIAKGRAILARLEG